MSEPQRVMLDLSELATGIIPESSDYESDDNHSMTNLVRTLVDQFEVNPPSLHLDDLNNNPNEVTIASTEDNANKPTEAGNLEVDPPTTETDNSTNNNENPLLAANSSVGAKIARRQRFSYAKKFFYANSQLYLQVKEDLPPAVSTPELLGQVVACPTRKNNQQYRIHWVRPRHGEWPRNLKLHLRAEIPKETIHRQLKSMIKNCPENKASETIPPPQQQPILPLTQPTLASPHPARPVVPLVVNTPAASTAAAFAAVHTAGSISYISDLSSLGVSGVSGSTQSQSASDDHSSRRPSTRNTADEDDNSDDANTEDEDEFEVDFGETFWNPCRNANDDDSSDESGSERGDVGSFPADAGAHDFARLLQQCTTFNFRELTAEEANTRESPQKIYDGPSGLRQHVASSFRTPLGAFRRAGFSDDLIARWTNNSNT
jgi:hypothetical protein